MVCTAVALEGRAAGGELWEEERMAGKRGRAAGSSAEGEGGLWEEGRMDGSARRRASYAGHRGFGVVTWAPGGSRGWQWDFGPSCVSGPLRVCGVTMISGIHMS
jgi:hypothetical protein